jgi:hypothetical protein
MAIETINIGTSPNDGTGDPLRVAFDKTNDNFLTITADGGNEITVLNPTTATDTDLNVALQDILDAGGGGAVDSVNSQTGVVSIDLESVLTEGNRPIKYINDFTPYEFILEDKGKLLISGDGENMTLNADIFAEGDTLLIIPEVSDIQLIAGVGVNIYGNLGVPSNHTLRIGEMAMLSHRAIGDFWWLNIIPQITSQTIPQTTSFTAEVDLRYTANGTLTVTDPTPIANKGFIVHVIGGSVTIGGVAYTSGALVYRYYDGASWISTNMNNAITIDATPTDGSSNAVSSNGVFDALALKQDKVTGVSDTEIGYLDGVTSAIQTQLNNRVRYLVKDTAVSSAVTGTLAETLAKSYTIPANTLGANDYFRINCITTIKTGTADTSTIRVRISNTNTFAGSSLISTTAHSATTVNMKHMRDLAYRGGVLKGFGNTTTVFQDKDRVTTAYTSTTIDFTQAVYVFVSIQNANLGDSTVIEDVLISN